MAAVSNSPQPLQAGKADPQSRSICNPTAAELRALGNGRFCTSGRTDHSFDARPETRDKRGGFQTDLNEPEKS